MSDFKGLSLITGHNMQLKQVEEYLIILLHRVSKENYILYRMQRDIENCIQLVQTAVCRKCLLSFGAESFVFQVSIQKFKD